MSEERKMEIVIGSIGPGIWRSVQLMLGCEERRDSRVGARRVLIVGMRSGVMVTGNLRVWRVWLSSSS